jgi:hypothetical protein
MEHRMSTLELKELSHPSGEVIKIAAGKTLDLHAQGTTKMPAGSVIQVLTTRLTTSLTTSSTSFVDVGGSITITPKYANSLIYVMFKSHVYLSSGSAGWKSANFKMLRDSTILAGSENTGSYGNAIHTNATGTHMMTNYIRDYADLPNTTSAIVYKPQVMTISGLGIQVNTTYAGQGSMTIMEIAQ